MPIDLNSGPPSSTLVVDCAGWLRSAAAKVSGGSSLAEALLALLSDAGISTAFNLTIPFPTTAGGQALTPMDPVRVLELLTQAVQQAEETLAKENMMIKGGQIDSTFQMEDGAGGNATTHLVLTISPKTYS